MRTTLAVALALTALLASSAFCQYTYNWSDDFEHYGDPGIPETPTWHSPTGNPLVATTYPVHSGFRAVRQVANTSSCSAADLRSLSSTSVAYYRGYARFWVYDPGEIAGVRTEERSGIFSSAGADHISKMCTANISSTYSQYWSFQWGYRVVVGDGVSTQSWTGFSFTPGQAAPRIYNSWSYVRIAWDFAYSIPGGSQGSGTVKWWVNQSQTPNMTVNVDSTAAGWTNMHDVAGVFLGSLATQGNPTTFDDVEFHADAVPEPSNMLILGSGLVGIIGLIRRRR